jgi:hypothetical protein
MAFLSALATERILTKTMASVDYAAGKEPTLI